MHNIKLWRVFPESLYFLSYPKSVMPFHSKIAFLWQFNVAGTVKHTSVYASSARNSSPILTKFIFCQQIFRRVHNVKLHGNPCSWSRTDTDGQMDRQILRSSKALFCDYENEPKNWYRLVLIYGIIFIHRARQYL
jgi:hypothetical protein